MHPDALPTGIVLPRGTRYPMSSPELVRGLMAVKPTWKLGEKGPTLFDCWSLTQLVQFCRFGRLLPVVNLRDGASRTDILRAVAHDEAHGDWREHGDAPGDGDAVTMAHGDVPWHVGTYLAVDRGLIIHISERAGLCVDGTVELKAKGFTSLRFHRYVGGAK